MSELEEFLPPVLGKPGEYRLGRFNVVELGSGFNFRDARTGEYVASLARSGALRISGEGTLNVLTLGGTLEDRVRTVAQYLDGYEKPLPLLGVLGLMLLGAVGAFCLGFFFSPVCAWLRGFI